MCPECNAFMLAYRYLGCNVAISPATEPNATATWGTVGHKIRVAAAAADRV